MPFWILFLLSYITRAFLLRNPGEKKPLFDNSMSRSHNNNFWWIHSPYAAPLPTTSGSSQNGIVMWPGSTKAAGRNTCHCKSFSLTLPFELYANGQTCLIPCTIIADLPVGTRSNLEYTIKYGARY